MNGGVDAPVQQGLIEFLGEQPLAALIQQPALQPVAAGLDHLDGDFGFSNAVSRGDEPPHQVRLGERQR